MSGIATAVVAGSVISSTVASKSASKAAKAQGKAADATVAEQRRQFDITQANLQPFQAAGGAALEQQRILLGLGASDPFATQRADLQRQLADLQGASGVGGGGGFLAGAIGQGRQSVADKETQSEIARIQSELDALPAFEQGDAEAQQQAAFDRLANSPGQQFLRDRAQKIYYVMLVLSVA